MHCDAPTQASKLQSAAAADARCGYPFTGYARGGAQPKFVFVDPPVISLKHLTHEMIVIAKSNGFSDHSYRLTANKDKYAFASTIEKCK